MSIACTHADIFAFAGTAAEKCAAISATCAPTQSLLNFYSLYYCRVRHPAAMAGVLAAVIALVFIFTYEIVDEYVVPAVLCIVRTLRMSDALAGVTLLAFANGAGDVITALVASGKEEAVAYNVGGVVGAGLFVVTVVVSLTAELSPRPIVLTRPIVFRDLPVYALATAYLLFCGARGQIALADAAGIVALYLVVVVAVLAQERGGDPRGADKRASVPLGRRSAEEELEGFIAQTDGPASTTELPQRKSLKRALRSFSMAVQREEEAQAVAPAAGWAAQAVGAVDWPLRCARRLTIPPCNEELYSRRLLALCPLAGLPFLLWALGLDVHWPLCLPVALTLAFALHAFAPARLPPDSAFALALSAAGVLLGVLWTKAASELLIDALGFVGTAANLSSTYLGLTVIAVGSALPDAVTTVALARNGQAVLGLTGGYAGQIFGLLVGLGSAMAKKAYLSGRPVRFELFRAGGLRANLQLILVLCTTLFAVASSVVWVAAHGLRVDKRFGRFLLATYALFFGACTAVSALDAYRTF